MITQDKRCAGAPIKSLIISGIVRAEPRARMRGTIKKRNTTSPAAPDSNHHIAGVPTSYASPHIPTVADPPTQEAMIEKPT